MSDLTKQPCFLSQTRVTETACIPLRLPAIVAGLLMIMPLLLTGCGGGGGGETGSAPSAAPAGATASLAWSPVQDPSVTAYFVHYGRQSPGQPGSCTYESSKHVAPPTDTATAVSATVTDLEPNTVYYFTVSAYNGIESACSDEVSTVTPPASV
jgi:Fibronectin type III domain